MGVLACSRKNCDNIMCDCYIPEIGYICYNCKDEFKEYLENKGKIDISEQEIIEELKIFMSIDKNYNYFSKDKIDIDNFFNNYNR
jgi:hypothetical protein